MKLRTTGHAACLVLVCTILLQVHSAPLEDSTWQQPGAADSITPLTVKPLGTSIVPQDHANQPNWDTRTRTASDDISSEESHDRSGTVASPSEPEEAPKVRRSTYRTVWRNERDSESDSSQVSAEVNKRSADDDSPSGNEETGDDGDDSDDTTDTSQEQDDASTEDTEDDPSDKRRRRSANSELRQKRQVREDSNEDEDDGGLTREAAIVSPIRRRRSPEHKEDTDVSTNEPLNYDDASPDTIQDTESTEPSTDTLRRGRKRGEAETSTVGSLDGSPVIVVAPSGVPVKEIPQALNHTLQTLQRGIDHFEAAVIGGQSTVPTVGVLAGVNTKKDKDTIIHAISSAQYIVH